MQLAPCLALADSDRLDEVLVTARRREERLLDVPDSVTALSAATIQSAHITTVKDVALRVPNFSLVEGQQPGAELLNVRGVCQARNGDPPVAVAVDGVQISNAVQISQALFDVERIEVLKGPQGAVYGRNAIGGAINITTCAPTCAAVSAAIPITPRAPRCPVPLSRTRCCSGSPEICAASTVTSAA